MVKLVAFEQYSASLWLLFNAKRAICL